MGTVQNYDDIVRKVRGLLAKSNESFDDEGQNAFLLAQRLMVKYQIDRADVEDMEKQEIESRPASNYKKLLWWERDLAGIIANNFRVKLYYNNKYSNGYTYRQLVFYGFSEDTDLANEMYVLAYEALRSATAQHMQYHRTHRRVGRPQPDAKIRNSYRKGFIDGLSEKFNDQIHDLKGKYELVVITPVEVEAAFAKMVKDWDFLAPTLSVEVDSETYTEGFNDGNSIDLTRSTLDGSDVTMID